jgi:hypothetical protein
MRRIGNIQGETRNSTNTFMKTINGLYHLGDVDGFIILKWILQTYIVKV